MQSSNRHLLNKVHYIFSKQNNTADVYIRDILAIEAAENNATQYGEFIASKCRVVFTPIFPNTTYLASLPHAHQAAYVIVGDEIYYKRENEYTLKELHPTDQKAVNKIKNKFNITPDSRSTIYLTTEQLKYISPIINHQHIESLETEVQLVSRMIAHISSFVAIAKVIHEKDNFKPDNSSQMKKDCINNITRLSFNEFSLYPSEKQGPLTQAGFMQLISEIEKMAMMLPQNLHLLIASFPVVNDKNEVHNLVCYVQCGSTPRMNVFAKSFPSAIDCLYPGTTNAFISSGSAGQILIAQTKSFYEKKQLFNNIQELKEFKWRNLRNPDYPPPQSLKDLLNDRIKQLKSGSINLLDDAIFIYKFEQELEKFQNLIHKIEDKFIEENMHFSPNTIIPQKNTSGYQYGGNFEVTTAGGVKLGKGLDICVDLLLGVAKKAFNQDLCLAQKTVEPRYISKKRTHLIASGSIDICEEKIVGKNATHADIGKARSGIRQAPDYQKEEPIKEHRKVRTYFGISTLIMIYKPQLVNELTGEDEKSIAEHNQLMFKIQAIKHLAVQQPRLLPELNKELCEYLIYEVTNRSEKWHTASHTEKAKIFDYVKDEISKIDNLLEHGYLGKIILDLTTTIQNYLFQKESLIKNLQVYILARKNESHAVSFFKNALDSNEEIRDSAAPIILAGLLNEKEIKLSIAQLDALTDSASYLGATLFRYYKLNILNELLPPYLIDAYKKIDTTPAQPLRSRKRTS